MVMLAPWLMPVIAARNCFSRAGIGVERLEEARAAALDLVLRLPGAQRLGEVAPERIEAMVRHLEDAADVGRLLPVEEQVGLGRVGVAVAGALQEAERDQRVEEVARRARVQAEPRR